MNRHEGVSCDACLKSNFRGRRFKCLICYDYDLCANCHEENASSSRHLPDHPMQCILTRTDFELYYGGEVLSAEQPQSFTCPYCNKMGLTDVALAEHVSAEHTDASTEVVCPVCAAMQGGEPNFVTDDFAGHLSLEHRTGQRDLISFLDEPSAIRHGGVRRIPHSGRALGGGQRSRRSNMHFSSSGALSTLSPSGRESVDPITELLSHLTSVRRGPQSSQLQQLQMQIQMERQQISAARQQLERLPRRQPHPITSLTGSSSTPGSGSNGAGGLSATLSGNTFLQALTQQQANGGSGGGSSSGNGITISNFSQIPIASSSASVGGGGSGAGPATSNGGTLATAIGGIANPGLTGSVVGNAANAAGNNQATGTASNQSQFLLARLLTTPLDEKAQQELEVERADRAQFVQALLLSTLANLDSFRLSEHANNEPQPEISDTLLAATAGVSEATIAGGEAEEQPDEDMQDLGDDVGSRNPLKSNNTSSNNNNRCTNNAVNKKLDELEGNVVVVVGNTNNNNNVTSSSDSRQSSGPAAQPPPPVKPKPPTATKPVPHNLPNYASERGAGRGGGIAAGGRAAGSSAGPAGASGGGGGVAKGRSSGGQQQPAQQQQQSHHHHQGQSQQQQSNQGSTEAARGSGGAGGGGATGRDCGSQDAR